MTADTPISSSWADAATAAALIAIDPVGLGGAVVRCGPGPQRDRWVGLLRTLLPPGSPVRRIPLHIEDERLLGGLDLAASLAAGHPVVQHGVLAECDGGIALLSMAERVEAAVAARLAATLDRGEVAIERDGLATRLTARIGLVALDEGLVPEERPPEALLERLAFHLVLGGGNEDGLNEGVTDAEAIMDARRLLARVAAADDSIVEGLCMAADLFGIGSPRAAILAVRAARAHAALRGRVLITAEDAVLAARLVLRSRAVAAPVESEASLGDETAPHPPESPPASGESGPVEDSDPPSETQMVIDAIRAALPDNLMDRVNHHGPARARAGPRTGVGARVKSAQRGRPIGSHPAPLRSGDRLDIVQTLRAATPWQKLRGGGLGAGRMQVRQQDFRVRRFVQEQETTTIFVVDASGSTAIARLAEAKGAVELLLAKAYVSRSRVALIAFRGPQAELLLPATRSLTRAKRQLADLPGGGGTPLAAGIDAAVALAGAEKAKQRTPLVVLLTDGRANIDRHGAPGRSSAMADALVSAGRFRAGGFGGVFIDTSARPRPDADQLALAMGAVYAPLPHLDAHAMVSLLDDLQPGPRQARPTVKAA